MGTRADFYIKKAGEKELIWLGSTAWDGYPEGINKGILLAKTEADYIKALQTYFQNRDDVTLPERGWPWPWDDSNTTDFAYCFVDGRTLTNNFGDGWHIYQKGRNNDKAKIVWDHEFPDMSKVKNVRYDKGSGLIHISIK